MGIQIDADIDTCRHRLQAGVAGRGCWRAWLRLRISLAGRVLALLLPALLPLTVLADILSAPLPPPGATRPDSLVVVVDRSTPNSSGLDADELALLVATARGAAAGTVRGRGFVVCSGEATEAGLGAAGPDTTSCEGECELMMGRRLRADWLLCLRVRRFESRWTLQATLFRVSDETLLGGGTRACDARSELAPSLQELVGELCSSRMPAEGGAHLGAVGAVEEEAPATLRERLSALDVIRSFGPGTSHSRRIKGRAGIRNRFYLEAGYGSGFFYPRRDAGPSLQTVSWGGGLRLADPSRERYDLLLDWWRAQDDEMGYALLRAVAEITPLHLGPFHPYGRLGYQVIKTHTKQDERMLLGGAGVEFRSRGFLALSGGMDLLANRGSKIRLGSINRCWRSELALSGAHYGLGVVGLFGGDVKANASISARLRLFKERKAGHGRGARHQ